jgi:tocopherol O-methyltransferase
LPAGEIYSSRTHQGRAAESAREYYDSVQWLYNLWGFLFAGNGGAIHYGLWFSDTKSLADAALNSSKIAASSLSLSPSDVVLDAGCGVGASAVFFAQSIGSEVVGITVSDVQLRQAKRLAARKSVNGLCRFFNMDYTQTYFENETFTKVVGIESICYAATKADFIREAYRLLTPNGRLVIIDGFMRRPPVTEEEGRLLGRWLTGWGVPSLSTVEEFRASLSQEHFVRISYTDFHRNVIPSALHYYRASKGAYPFVSLLRRGGLVSDKLVKHYESTMIQKSLSCSEDPIITYGMFVADKP